MPIESPERLRALQPAYPVIRQVRGLGYETAEAIADALASVLASLSDGSLYSMGAYFSDQHPELVDEVIAQAETIEQRGLRGYAEEAEMSRRHNNANVLTLAGRRLEPQQAEEIVERFLLTEFEGGRHERRVDQIAAVERGDEL